MKRKNLYDYFYGTGNNKPLTKADTLHVNRFTAFWKIYFRKFFKFVTVNLVYTIFTYPLFCAALVYLVSHSETFLNLMSDEKIMGAFPWLAVMTTGSVELLSSENMGSLIERLEKDFDYIFLDTPPVNLVIDTIVVSKYVIIN